MKGYSTLKNSFKNISPWMRRGFLLVLAILVLSGSFLIPQPANAQLLECTTNFTCYIRNFFANWIGAAIGSITAFILAIINWFLSIIAFLTKEIVGWMISFSLSVPYTSGPVIDSTWPVTRDLANMGLILVLVAIGIGTILNLKQGEYRKRLGAFFLVALLINFTPVITGVVIDMSNITARVFYDSAINSPDALISFGPGEAFGADFGATYELLGAAWRDGGEQSSAFQASIAVIVKGVAGIAFNIMLIFLFILLGVLFLARILFLWILVVLSPLAFLLYILPSTKKWFDKWWTNFFQWSIIVVPLLFFLWMAGLFANNGTAVCTSTIQSDGGITYYDTEGASFAEEEICSAANAFLASMALFAGVVISLNSSAVGAKIVTKKTKQYSTALGKSAARGVEKGAYRTYGKGKHRFFTDEGKEGAARAKEARRAMSFTEKAGHYAKRGVGAIAGGVGVNTVREKARGRYEEVSQEWKKNNDFNGWTPKARLNALGYERDPEKRAKLLDLLANDTPWELQRHFSEMSEKEKEDFKKEVAQREQFFSGSSRSVYSALPQLQSDKDLEKWADLIATSQHFRNLGTNELADERVVDAIVKAGKFNQLANAIRTDAKKVEQLDRTLGNLAEKEHGLAARDQLSEEEEKKIRARVKREAKERGLADFTHKDPAKGNLGGTKWEFSEEFQKEVRKEMEQEVRSRQAKKVPEYIKSSSPSKPESVASHPALAAALSASQESGVLEKALTQNNLSPQDKDFVRNAVRDAVETDIKKAFEENRKEAKKGAVQTQKAIEATKQALLDTSDMHGLSQSQVDIIAQEIGPEIVNEMKRSGTFSDIEDRGDNKEKGNSDEDKE